MRRVLGVLGVGLFVACGGNSPSNTGGGFGGSSGGSSGSGYSSSGSGGSGSGGSQSSSGSNGSSGGVGTSSGFQSGSSGTSGSGSGASSSGTSSSGTGSSSGTSSSGGGSSGGTMPPNLPTVSGTCPTFSNGATVTVSAGGGSIQGNVWMGSGGGPLIIYWHGTGSSATAEVPTAFNVTEVTGGGGMIVGFEASTRTGTTTGNTGDNVWYQSDAAFADQVVACAIQKSLIDPRSIHTAGYSAGGLQTVYMWFARSGYIASVISYSGGTDYLDQVALQDPSNAAAAIVAHGAMGSDSLGIDFYTASQQWEGIISMDGGHYIDCNDGGSHVNLARLSNLAPVSFKFFQAHPFGVKPEPYTSLPSGFPTYCMLH